MERISSPLAEFAKVLCTSQVLITARAVPTKRASVQCVGKRFWIPKTTSKRPSRCIYEVSGCLYDFAFCFKFSRHIRDVQVTK
uniref:CXXC repeat containing interactor of PDZ3 domain n=1 Tax=Molossus molossus TaxID=27622 RepID=A0A7J8E1M9_MOLMO|nr:CXXC repeat containing interactor of PDZ3 domain [Molossus molossus]